MRSREPRVSSTEVTSPAARSRPSSAASVVVRSVPITPPPAGCAAPGSGRPPRRAPRRGRPRGAGSAGPRRGARHWSWAPRTWSAARPPRTPCRPGPRRRARRRAGRRRGRAPRRSLPAGRGARGARRPSGRACSCWDGTPLRRARRLGLGRIRDLATLRGAVRRPPTRSGRGKLHAFAIDGDRPALEDHPGGTVSYLLRLVVPDKPGILGAVATALGAAGIDIVTLDVLERGNGVAVDDVVVELPPGRLPDSLITAAQTVPGVSVESVRPFAGPLDTHRELDLLDALAGAAKDDSAKLLAPQLPRVFHSGWAVVLSARPSSSAAAPWEVTESSEAAPALEGLSLPWMPLTGPRLLPSEDDWLPERWREMAIEMMAAPYGGPGCAVLLGRSGGPAFRRSELLRLAHLTGIATTVTSLPPV